MDQMIYWIWLSLSVTEGSTVFKKLISKFNNPEDIYSLTKEEIISVIGSRSRDVGSLSNKSLERAKSVFGFCTKHNVGLLTYSDCNYPERLRLIPNPPVILYYRGTLPDFSEHPPISVVGTRRLTDYGRRNAFSISYDLAKCGACIVSGMATGVDGVAHAAALSAGGVTVAVIGSGINICYPPTHLTLARQIVKSGCVMTAFAPGTMPLKQNFPKRNRIISALCDATILIEGKERSGALITARHAKEQEREVYALPGNVGNVTSEAANLLIKNGAKLITCAYDVIADFERSCPGALNPFKLSDERPSVSSVLSFYKVSATAQSDKLFSPSKSRRGEHTSLEIPDNAFEDNLADDTCSAALSEEEIQKRLSSLDKITRTLYERIPKDKECPTDALVGGEINMRHVMKGILALEMVKIIEILPGDRVKRI